MISQFYIKQIFKKLKDLLEISLYKIINDSHVSNKVIFSFTWYNLSDVEKSVLCMDVLRSVKFKSSV